MRDNSNICKLDSQVYPCSAFEQASIRYRSLSCVGLTLKLRSMAFESRRYAIVGFGRMSVWCGGFSLVHHHRLSNANSARYDDLAIRHRLPSDMAERVSRVMMPDFVPI